MKKIVLLCILVFCTTGFAQFSKTHYIPPLSGSENQSSRIQEQYLYISTPNINPVNFKIIQLGGTIILGTVSKAAPYIYDVGYGTDTQLHTSRALVNSIQSNKGYIIEAEDLVYVSARILAGNGNHAGALVSKGLAALGTQFRIGGLNNNNVDAANYSTNHYTFVSILATENNTLVQFNDIRSGATLINNATAGNTPAWITLNSGESFVMAVEGPNDGNRDALLGSLVSSDKPIAVNCGSFSGSNANTNLDLGFDQIVSVERTGTEYIFIKSTGQDVVERVLLIAHEANTEIRLNGNTAPTPNFTLINPGDYVMLDGSDYNSNGNLYVQTNKNTFAYQSIGDNSRPDFANQELFFVPPLSCETPHVIDNIPQISKVGTRTFIGRVTIITETASTLTFNINGINYSLFALNFIPGVTIAGPFSVTGNANYQTYTITGLTGNVAVSSTTQLYLASYGTDDAATFGGFYSGFTFKPEISFALVNAAQLSCIPNTNLSVNTLSPFDVFQWYFNGTDIPGAINSNYTPTQPGYYYVKATIADCGTTLFSDEIPISSCPTDMDNDTVNDNIDIDNDGDGLTNCTESLGDLSIDVSQTPNGNITFSPYSNSFTTTLAFAGSNQSDHSFAGNPSDLGVLYTSLSAGKDSKIDWSMNFAQPISISLQYAPLTADPAFRIGANTSFILKTSADKTITVTNPTNQLLIDTNYDGIYESGITSYSSFEIRFRLNGNAPLALGTGTFQFRVNLASSLTLLQNNLSDASITKSAFFLKATCVPKDSDGDGISDQLDIDSDNDGMPDNIESQGVTFVASTAVDINRDGLSDAYDAGIIPVDSDGDGVADYLDLDSDNDGIYDLIESGNGAIDADFSGTIDGNPLSFGNNGFSDSVETAPDSGIINYIIANTDGDTIADYLELDSDSDGCFDAIEAGYADGDNDGLVGNVMPIVNANGIVTNVTTGYTALPNMNYTIAAPMAITTQPIATSVCRLQDTSISVTAGTPIDGYQWQVLTGGIWNDVLNNLIYSGMQTATLQITGVTAALNGLTYRVLLDRIGNSCGLISDQVLLTVFDLPVVTSPVPLIQCDEDAVANAITDVNLRQSESVISSNALNEVFTYYTTQIAAETADAAFRINTPTAYNTGNGSVWVRVVNTNLCFSIAQIDITVTATNIPPTFQRMFSVCDDYIDMVNDDRDGIATFNFSSVTTDINNLLPSSSGFSIKYYRNAADAAAETDDLGNSLEIANIDNYRNIGYPGTQQIWVRIESDIDNACFGLGPYITVTVEPLPDIRLTDVRLICENNPQDFITLDAGLPEGQLVTDYTYVWSFENTVILGENGYALDVNTAGNYTVEVTSLFGCTRTQTILVNASDIAHIQDIDVMDLTDINTIAIYATGSGDYVYSLDYPDNFQVSPFFNDVIPGVHDIYIKDLRGCGIVGPVAVAVLGAPRYFTPNGDGYNDTWNLKGANAIFNKNAVIRIFDRFGKFIKQIGPAGAGWDGTFNDKPLPGDDYWYNIQLEDGRIVKGHFALKR
jgi:gliding motility-associated-like protein